MPFAGTLADQLADRRFIVAAAIASGGRPAEAVQAAAVLQAQGAGVFAVQPAQSARTHSDSLDLALHLQQQAGVETIATLTTWDKTIMTLQAELLGAHALGIRNVICTTGSPPVLGDYPAVDGIWEVDSLGLIALLTGLNEGRDSNGLATATQTSFCVGARVDPGARDQEAEIARARAKVRGGSALPGEQAGLRAGLAAPDGDRAGGHAGPAAAVRHPAAQLRRRRLPGQRGPRGDDPAGHAAGHGAGRAAARPAPPASTWPPACCTKPASWSAA